MKVYEAAKKYNIKTKEFLETLKKNGIEKSSHLQNLNDEEEKKVDEIYNPKPKSVAAVKVIKKSNSEVLKPKMIFNNPSKFKAKVIKKNNQNNDNEEEKYLKDRKVFKTRDTKDNRESKDFNNRKKIDDKKVKFNKFNKDRNDNKFDKDKDSDSKPNFNRSNKQPKKEQKKDLDLILSEQPSSKNTKGKKSRVNNKKHEYNKKEKEEIKEIRTDFRIEIKNKKKKKKEKVLKDEIIRVDGDSIGMIKIKDEISLKELSEKLGVNVTEIIKDQFLLGKIYTINTILTFEEAEEITLKYDIIVEKEETEEVSYGEKYNLEVKDDDKELKERAPIITIMGHVDHGKTSLLDALRHTNVIDTEAGGITQSIGAYQVVWNDKTITFIDTPGHEAFTEMRVRGTTLTDIAVLVVAADDGVKPQTIEAISHAKDANVPIIVAINKIDKEGANPMKIKQDLTEYGLVATEWGGQTDFIEISAKYKKNLDQLLETILITAELLELKANPKKRAKGIVIESRLDTNMGAVADILIQEGELKKNDIFVVGTTYGKVRKMIDFKGNEIEKAGPSEPVEITGFSSVPVAGDTLYCVNNEKQAKKIVEDYLNNLKENELNKRKHISLESLSKELENQQLKELKCIIRADTTGSCEALKDSLVKLSTDEVNVIIVQASTGAITESDIKLAEASNALIIGFNVRPTTAAQNEASRAGVEIRTYNVIYHAIEEIEKALKGMQAPKYNEIYLGRLEILKVFKITNVGNVAGCQVVDGKVTKNSKMRIIRDGIIIHTGELDTLKRYKDEVKEATLGQECGISVKNYEDIKVGDIIESFYLEETKQ